MSSGEQEVVEFFNGRGGFDHWWHDIDAGTKQEIRDGIAAIFQRIQHDAKLEGLREALKIACERGYAAPIDVFLAINDRIKELESQDVGK